MSIETETAGSAPEDVTKAPAQEELFPDPAPEAQPLQPFLCAVSADLYRRAWQARSKDATRHRMTGVFIEPCADGGATLTATDGHFMIQVRDPDGYVKGAAIVSLNELMLRACKPRKDDLETTDRVLLINFEGGDHQPEAVVAHVPNTDPDISRDNAMDLFRDPTGMVICVEYGPFIINESFPDAALILPRGDEVGTSGAAINATLLKPIIEALKPPFGKTCQLQFFTQAHEPDTSPMLVKPERFVMPHAGGGFFEGFAIIMPMRGASVATPGLPDWVRTQRRAT